MFFNSPFRAYFIITTALTQRERNKKKTNEQKQKTPSEKFSCDWCCGKYGTIKSSHSSCRWRDDDTQRSHYSHTHNPLCLRKKRYAMSLNEIEKKRKICKTFSKSYFHFRAKWKKKSTNNNNAAYTNQPQHTHSQTNFEKKEEKNYTVNNTIEQATKNEKLCTLRQIMVINMPIHCFLYFTVFSTIFPSIDRDHAVARCAREQWTFSNESEMLCICIHVWKHLRHRMPKIIAVAWSGKFAKCSHYFFILIVSFVALITGLFIVLGAVTARFFWFFIFTCESVRACRTYSWHLVYVSVLLFIFGNNFEQNLHKLLNICETEPHQQKSNNEQKIKKRCTAFPLQIIGVSVFMFTVMLVRFCLPFHQFDSPIIKSVAIT